MHESLQRRMFGRDPSPVRVGRFVVLGDLGEGAMGVVFAGVDPELDRKVAIKLLRAPDPLEDGESRDDARARLGREARALARLSHPNVVTVFEVGDHEGRTYLAMEFVDGVDLRRWLEDADAGWRERLGMLLAAGEGLAAAHRAGLVHRDFKPANVLVGADGRVRVADFGLVRYDSSVDPLVETTANTADGPPSVETKTDTVLGTPAYMAPEQRHGGPVDPRADQYAFCVTAHEVLFGVRPGDGPPATGVPRRIHSVLRRGLDPDPSGRFESMDDLLAALRRAAAPGRRWWLVALGAASVAGIAVATMPGGGCPPGAERWQEQWGPTQQARLADALEAVDPELATRVLPGTTRALERYGRGWSTTHDAVCHGDSGPALRELQLRCLDDRAAEVQALVAVLAEGDDYVAANAAAAVRRLPSPRRCRDAEQLARARIGPEHDASGRQADDMITDAAARLWAGRPEDALPRLQEVLARDEGSPAITAAVRWRMGQARGELGDSEAAREDLVAAFAAAEHTDDDRLRAEIALSLAHQVGYRQSRERAGLDWLEVASAIVERLETRSVLEVRRQTIHGAILYSAGRYSDSAEQHEEALQLLEELDPHDEVAIGAQQVRLSGALLEIGKAEAALGLVRDAIGRFEAESVTDARLGNAHNTLSNALLAAGEYEPAAAAAQTALDIFDSTRDPAHPDVAMAHNNLAVALASAGTFLEAVPHFERALAIWRDRLGEEHPRVGTGLGNLALAQFMLGRWEEALAGSDRALVVQRRVLQPDHPDLALLQTTRGRCLKELQRYDESLSALLEAERIVVASLGEQHEQHAAVLLEIGATRTASGDPEAGVAPLERSCAILERSGASKIRRADALFALGRAQWLAGNDPEQARATLTEAEELFERSEGSWASLRAGQIRSWVDTHVTDR